MLLRFAARKEAGPPERHVQLTQDQLHLNLSDPTDPLQLLARRQIRYGRLIRRPLVCHSRPR
jgi:hypothetical protein